MGADPVYEFSYTIPDEDPSPGETLLEDEVADSRRHQFVALSRQGNPQTEFPHLWINPEDVQAAVEKNLIATTTVGPDETMVTSPIWSDHFVRITPDDARRPISWDSVAAPVEWDTSSADSGVYMLWGYTWEPAFNLWSQRAGNVVIVHDGDPTAVGPAIAITNGELIVKPNETALIEGCGHGAEGTTLTGEFAFTPGNGATDEWEPEWISFAENVPLDGDSFGLEFVAGEDFQTLLVRVIATDPQGRTYVAHMPQLLIELGGETGSCEETSGGGLIGNPGCGGEDTGDTTASDGSTTATTSPGTSGSSGSATDTDASSMSGTTTAPAADGGSGGTCAVDRRNGGFSLLLLGLLGLRRRRSRA